MDRRSIDSVLLTGATGYVGIHVLHELVTSTKSSVTCLVRAPGAEAAKARLLGTFAWYFPDFDLRALDHRVAVAAGDIGSECFGLTTKTFDQLRQTQRVIINCAANLGQSGSARAFDRINVEGVARLADFARSSSAELHHLSTINVVGSYHARPAFESFTELQLDEGQVFSGPYAETKYKAELLMRSRLREGLKGAVYRVGYVAPHSKTGRFQNNIHENQRARLLRSAVKLGVAAFQPRKFVRLTPVDSVANAIVTLLTTAAPAGETYYVQTPQEVSQQNIVSMLHAVGYPIRLIDPKEFAEKVRYLVADGEELSGAIRRPKDEGLFTVPPNGEWSVKELSRVGFEYPRISSAWFAKFLGHCVTTGFLEAPKFWALGRIVDELW